MIPFFARKIPASLVIRASVPARRAREQEDIIK
jgi:hypothetical protein